MDVFDYLNTYKDVSFKEMTFNEIDALVLALVSYVPCEELNLEKEKISSAALIKLIDEYKPKRKDSPRKLKYIQLLRMVCEGKRYNKAVFAHYKKIRDKNSDKQFQAITIIFPDFIYISYCGTDATVLGWKEDFNMAILEIVPSEIEAIKYANMVIEKHWSKKVVLGGHSKGGRLAITAAKGLNKKKRLSAIFAFDAPNYPSACYNADYKKIDSYILSYAPNESIIGRLMNEYHQKKIIKSSNTLLMQHDAFSWLIDDRCFSYDFDYTAKSTRIVNTINQTLYNSDEETKHQFIDTLFDYLDRLDIETLPQGKDVVPLLILKAPSIISEWKNIPKENKSAVKKIIFEILKDYLINP